MTFWRAVRLLSGGTLFFTIAVLGATLHFAGPDLFERMDAAKAGGVLAAGYQLSAFVMLLVLFPTYWFRLVMGGFKLASEVDPGEWAKVPWFFRVSKFNAVYLPHTLTPTGRMIRDELLVALEGMMGMFLLAASLFGLALLGPEYFIGFSGGGS